MGSVEVSRTTAEPTRVMLVEDSAVVRGMVRKWLGDIPGIQVVESAENGQAALDMVGTARPDIIILDIEMPVMDGLTALPGILQKVPQAKVIIASTLSRRNAEVSLKAMSLGASDYIAKPSFAREGNEARAAFQEELTRKVLGLAKPPTMMQTKGRANDSWGVMPAPGSAFKFRKPSLIPPRVLAIGSSTGGPAALNKVFEQAKPALGKLPVFIAQHTPPTFTALLGEKLCKIAELSGGEAVHGEIVKPGHLYVAPGGKHMRVRKRGMEAVIELDDGPPINHCRPAVDPLFDSIADVYGNATLAAVLTGMGSDGARGATRIADAGGTVYAQDEASSVVWGMPGATALAGACTALLDVDEFGGRIAQSILRGGKS